MIAKLRIFSEDNQQYNFLYNVRFQNAISAKGVGFRLRKTDGTLNQRLKSISTSHNCIFYSITSNRPELPLFYLFSCKLNVVFHLLAFFFTSAKNHVLP
jgi:hypothetical protein